MSIDVGSSWNDDRSLCPGRGMLNDMNDMNVISETPDVHEIIYKIRRRKFTKLKVKQIAELYYKRKMDGYLKIQKENSLENIEYIEKVYNQKVDKIKEIARLKELKQKDFDLNKYKENLK